MQLCPAIATHLDVTVGNNNYTRMNTDATDDTALGYVGFKYSTASNYADGDASIAVTVEDVNKGYCLEATSASDKVFVYSSPNGLGQVGVDGVVACS